jgi:hypothetical protein
MLIDFTAEVAEMAGSYAYIYKSACTAMKKLPPLAAELET